MSRDGDQCFPPEWPGERLKRLQQQLSAGTLPQGLINLLGDSAPVPAIRGVGKVESEMYSFILSDALEGIDIGRRYPAFFRRLLADEDLLEEFLLAVKLLVATAENRLKELPAPPDQDLSFLHDGRNGAQDVEVRATANDCRRWRVRWRRAQGELQDQLSHFLHSQRLHYRSSHADLAQLVDDAHITLLDEEVDVAGHALTILLEGIHPAADGAHLELALLASFSCEESPPLQAQLRWGAYEARADVDDHGRAAFPDLPLAAIVEDDGRTLRNGLRLVVAPAGSDGADS